MLKKIIKKNKMLVKMLIKIKRSKIFTRLEQCKNRFILSKKNVVIASDAYIDSDTVFEGNNLVRNKSCILQSVIGKGSYLTSSCYFFKTKVGRYCSIALGVKIVAGRHPLSPFVSTSPVFYSRSLSEASISFGYNQNVQEYKYADRDNQYLVVIGNDVWLGTDVLIMEGVTVGDGAIVGAGAVVTKNVEPYSIVGGCPAKVIKMRFEEDEIKFLLNFKWWDKDENWLKQNCHLFYDIKKFIAEQSQKPNNNSEI